MVFDELHDDLYMSISTHVMSWQHNMNDEIFKCNVVSVTLPVYKRDWVKLTRKAIYMLCKDGNKALRTRS